ncbi:MAG: formate dehydrogenase accessory sulfurtransferase FdhD [Bacteroidota bacterium]
MRHETEKIQAPAQIQKVLTVDAKGIEERNDLLAVEAPLEIRLGYGRKEDRVQKSISITMRTPGHDLELSMGFLFGEGIIRAKEDIYSVKHCTDLGKEESRGNVVRVELAEDCQPDLKKLERQFYTTSSCGVCGKTSIEAIQNLHCEFIPLKKGWIKADLIHGLGKKVGERQQIFSHTGGLHAAALFSEEGELIRVREDVGRHNALDKLIGAEFYEAKLPAEDKILFLSGRISFELVQKALAARIPLIVAVGAPSSLAVELAEESGISLIGFARQHRFNIYTNTQRLHL